MRKSRPSTTSEFNARQYKRPLSRPEIGCYLSHYTLWKRIADEKLCGAVILEDDFDVVCSLKSAINDIQSAPLSGVMVKLFSRKPVRGVVVATLGAQLRLVSPDRVPGLTLGYTLDRVAAEMLLAKALPFGRPLDMDVKHWWEFGLSVLAVNPPPLRLGELATRSCIDPARVEAAAQANSDVIRRFLVNLRYQLTYNLQLLQARSINRRSVRRLREQITRQG